MPNRMMIQVLRHLAEANATNPFPAMYMPESLSQALEAAAKGQINLNPPVATPEGFRGRIAYDRQKCIGCKLCMKVCPANAITFLPEEKKVIFHVDRCCFCEQCTEICPVSCIWMTGEGLNSSYERKGEIVRDSGPRPAESGVEAPAAPAAAKTVYRIDAEGCIGCTKCARICPAGAISGELKKPHVIDPEKCVGCGECVAACPKKVIFPVE